MFGRVGSVTARATSRVEGCGEFGNWKLESVSGICFLVRVYSVSYEKVIWIRDFA